MNNPGIVDDPVTVMKKSILRSAAEHGGQFLLTRQDFHNKQSLMFRASEELVASGHARWIDSASNYFPGIALTAKPPEVP